MLRAFRFSLVATLVLTSAVNPSAAQATDFATDTSSLTGKILGPNGKALAGARLLSYHLSSERLYTTEPTGSNGKVSLQDLPYGYHDLAVETPDGLFVAAQVINIPPDSKAVVALTVLTAGASTALRAYPGSDAQTVGVARVSQRLRGREFWRSPRGVAVLAGAGAAILLLLAGGGGSSSSGEVDASPF